MIQNVKNRFQNHKIHKGRGIITVSRSIMKQLGQQIQFNFKIKQNLMAVIAEGMTFDAIDATPTAAARITFALKFDFPIFKFK